MRQLEQHPAISSDLPAARRGYGRQIALILAVIVILLGTYVRFADLATHFVHVDDIGVAQTIVYNQEAIRVEDLRANILAPNAPDYWSLNKILLRFADQIGFLPTYVGLSRYVNGALSIPRDFTYAPLQFFLTSALVSPGQGYRDVLFWGRFPSFLLGVLALPLILLVHRKLHGPTFWAYGLLSLSLMAFSWESIVYAQQMESYTIGVLSATLLLLCLFRYLDRPSPTTRDLIQLGAAAACLSYTQYQIIFLVPGLFAAIFLAWWRKRRPAMQLTKQALVTGLSYGLLVLPLYTNYLSKLASRGINWNAGPKQEYLFALPQGWALWEQARHVAGFFIKNTVVSLQSVVAMVPLGHPALPPLTTLLLLLAGAGLVSLFLAPERPKRYLGLYLLLSTLVWTVLVVGQKITLSPTRHSLILLPFLAVLVAEGLGFALRKLTRTRRQGVHLALSAGLVLLMGGLFVTGMPEVRKQRLDPFSENEIKQVLRDHQVRTIVAYGWTWNLGSMGLAQDGWRILALPSEINTYQRFKEDRPDGLHGPFAFVSHRRPLSPMEFEQLIERINNERRSDVRLAPEFGRYELLWSREVDSTTEIDFFPLTENGANGLYMYVYGLKKG